MIKQNYLMTIQKSKYAVIKLLINKCLRIHIKVLKGETTLFLDSYFLGNLQVLLFLNRPMAHTIVKINVKYLIYIKYLLYTPGTCFNPGIK